MGLREYIRNRILQTVITILATLTINFIIFRLMPGDPIRTMIRDPRIPKSEMDRLRTQFGLDKPLLTQFFLYLFNTFQGNLGISFVYKTPVTTVIMERLFNTAILTGLATILSIAVGILVGLVCSWKQGSKIDASALTFSLLTWATPTFWLSTIMIMIFSVYGGLLPVSGMRSVEIISANILEILADFGYHLILPLLTLTLVMLGQYALIVRSNMMEILTEDYILTAKAKGLSEFEIIRKHALKNTMLPTTSLIAINLGLVVAGTLEVETVFAWPGVGRLMYESILMLDFPVLQGIFLFFALFTIIANFLADVILAYVDPRIRY